MTWPSAFGSARQATTIDASGANVTAGTPANTKGSWVALTASSPWACDGFYLSVLGGTGGADSLIDIGIGGAGSETVILSDYMLSSSTSFTDCAEVYVPLPIKAGTRIVARSQASVAARECFVGVTLVAGRFYSSLRLGRAVTYGANGADSGGTTIDPGAVAATFGSWTQLSAAITAPIRYLIVCIGAGGNYTRTAANHVSELGVGAAASEVMAVPGLYHRQDDVRDNFTPNAFGRFIDIKSGARLAARGKCGITDAADRLYDLSVIGFS